MQKAMTSQNGWDKMQGPGNLFSIYIGQENQGGGEGPLKQ